MNKTTSFTATLRVPLFIAVLAFLPLLLLLIDGAFWLFADGFVLVDWTLGKAILAVVLPLLPTEMGVSFDATQEPQ